MRGHLGTSIQDSGITVDDDDNITDVQSIGLENNAGSFQTTIQAHDSSTENYSLYFPAAQGAAGQILHNSDGAGQLTWVEGPPLASFNYEANDFLSTLSADNSWWDGLSQADALAPAIVDPLLNMITVRRFPSTADTAIGFQFILPDNTVSIDFTLIWRDTGSDGGAGDSIVWHVHAREIAVGRTPDDALNTWTSTGDSTLFSSTVGEDEEVTKTTSNKTVAALGLIAGELTYFTIERETIAAGDDYAADVYLISLRVDCKSY